MQQIVDSPVLGGGLQDFRPGHCSTASSSFSHVPAAAAGEVFTGFFALFPAEKKVRSWVRTRGRN